jgi:dihydrodipicolinate synthase/N-acetylneuraminate lyase
MTLTHRILPNRPIEGISAVLLPFLDNGEPDLAGFLAHLERTFAAGLDPAVNMDTGYANLIGPALRGKILELTRQAAAGRRFVAGAYVEDLPGGLLERYCREAEAIQGCGGTPILFQCSRLAELGDEELVQVYRQTAARFDGLLAFELGQMFVPFGRIYSLEVFAELVRIPGLVGIKHSSLRRELEWQRLELRDRLRPDFRIYTGNDLAIDMVMYGSDYLLGLSTFAPDHFARRDAFWKAGDLRFYELNDVLQYLGQFAFRPPTAAYKHSAAQFLKLRGWIISSEPHPAALRRPDSDVPVLAGILAQLEALT